MVVKVDRDGVASVDSADGMHVDDTVLHGVVADFNKWRRGQGLAGTVYVRGGKKRIRTISVSNEAYDGLKYLAQGFGTYFGDNVSVSALIEAIGTFQLRVTSTVDVDSAGEAAS